MTDKHSSLLTGARRCAPTTLMALLFMGLAILPACKKIATTSTTATTVTTMYRCPMHPSYHSDKPGDCPICGMKLVPFAPTETPSSASSNVAGQAVVNADDNQKRMVGVRTAKIDLRELHLNIRASARVAYDPALYSAILEHQAAVESHQKSIYVAESEDTVKASTLRLRQMGLSQEQIDLVSQKGFDPSNLLLGKAGGTVWVYADIYDFETGLVKAGQEVEMTSPAFPGSVFHGTVRAVDSIVNAETRTLRARIAVPNPQGQLKPDMYMNATIMAVLGRKLAVPVDAVLNTGTRQLVFVETAPGEFTPRAIRVGRQADDYYEVLGGLAVGESVSTAANFLIDSESKLKAAVNGL